MATIGRHIGHPCHTQRAGRGRRPPGLSLGSAALVCAAALLGMPKQASACGGLFCNNSQPVNQAAERILFVDHGDGRITAAIEIQYQGPSEKFAWVLPLPGIEDPDEDIKVSSTLAFDRLQQATNPVYTLQTDFIGDCNGDARSGGFVLDTGAVAGSATTPGAGVIVEASGSVGPFDFELISVSDTVDDPADVAVDWLSDNGYDVTGIGADLLRPYLESDNQLLAVRLTKGNNAGAIRPLMITYQGTTPSIPIRPTAVAANPDMGVMVWVAGPSRAIPLNYNLLELNEAAIDWFNPNSTYNDVVIAAADEAGGHGFVTEYASEARALRNTIVPDFERQNWQALNTQDTTARQLYERVRGQFGAWDGVDDAFRAALIMPADADFTEADVVACPGCYLDESGDDPTKASLDLATLRDGITKLVLEPMFDTEALLAAQPYVTRLYTTLSADEMDTDPAFDFNPDLGDVDNQHTRTRVVDSCGDPSGPWIVRFDDGIVVGGEGLTWPVSAVDADLPKNVRILEASTRGEPLVMVDNSGAIRKLLEVEAPTPAGFGDDGCRVGGRVTAGSWLSLGLIGVTLLGLRRRRPGSTPA